MGTRKCLRRPIERLEDRSNPAGTITGSFAHGTWTLTGDALDNSIVINLDGQANAFKVVTERGTVYLMGRVTDREADRASELARSIAGVQRVVRVFEILSEAELANLNKRQ